MKAPTINSMQSCICEKSQKPLYICVRYWERDCSTETDILYATLREEDANSYCDNMNANCANQPWYYEVIKMVVQV